MAAGMITAMSCQAIGVNFLTIPLWFPKRNIYFIFVETSG